MEQFACRGRKSQFVQGKSHLSHELSRATFPLDTASSAGRISLVSTHVIVFWIPWEHLSMLMGMSTLSLSELLGLTVYDCSGSTVGRVREAALVPQEDRNRVSALIVKTSAGSRILPCGWISVINGSVRASTLVAEWNPATGSEGQFFLGRDLLDQQVIDVHGRKVVRVNDVDFYQENAQ